MYGTYENDIHWKPDIDTLPMKCAHGGRQVTIEKDKVSFRWLETPQGVSAEDLEPVDIPMEEYESICSFEVDIVWEHRLVHRSNPEYNVILYRTPFDDLDLDDILEDEHGNGAFTERHFSRLLGVPAESIGFKIEKKEDSEIIQEEVEEEGRAAYAVGCLVLAVMLAGLATAVFVF